MRRRGLSPERLGLAVRYSEPWRSGFEAVAQYVWRAYHRPRPWPFMWSDVAPDRRGRRGVTS